SARTALSSPDPAAALGDERARELRARGADMDWDQAVAYALTQTTQVLTDPEPGTSALTSGATA
ncbi:MAG TPA: hypothetical protein VEF71_25685, partial [Streptosporangiaceae bacterium]|nr:hypothetical protein [Streptosporangiaceae bacterium]